MNETMGWRFASGSRRLAAIGFVLAAATAGSVLVGAPAALLASDSTDAATGTTPPSGTATADLANELAAVQALTAALKFDEAQKALEQLAATHPDDARVAQEIWRLGIKRRMTRADALMKQGRNVETEAVWRGIIADAAAPDAGSLDAETVHQVRSKARRELMILYGDWGRGREIDPLWADFAADRGSNQAPYALKMGEEFREAGEFARSAAAYDMAAAGYSTATTEADLKALREARIGAAASGCVAAGSGRSVAEIAAIAGRASAQDRAEVYQRAIKFLLQMSAPEKILDLSRCAPDPSGRAVCRVRGLLETRDFDRAATESLQALRAMPSDGAVAAAAALVLQKMPAWRPGDLERGRAFFSEASALAQGEAAIRVWGGWALFLARVRGQREATLAVLDEMTERFADRLSEVAKEIERVAGEWGKQGIVSLEAEARELLSFLAEGSASLKHRRDAVKVLSEANSVAARVSESLASLSAFQDPGRNDALLGVADALVHGGYGRYQDDAQTVLEAVLANSPTEAQTESARLALARLEFARAAARPDGPLGEVLVRDDMPSTRALGVASDAAWRYDYATARALCRQALANARTDAERAQAQVELIKAALLCGDAAEALRVASGLSAADPDQTYALWNAVLYAVPRGGAETAAALCNGLVGLGFVNAGLLAEVCCAVEALAKGQATDTAALRRALLALPGIGCDTAAMMTLADALYKARRYAEARDLYERVTALTMSMRGPSLRSRAALALIEAEEGAITSAPLNTVRPDLSDCIGSAAAWLTVECLRPAPGASSPAPELCRRRLAVAEMLARRAPDSDFIMPGALSEQGELLVQLGDADEALRRLSLLVQRFPNNGHTPIGCQWIVSIWSAKAAACRLAEDRQGHAAALRAGVQACEEFARAYPEHDLGPRFGQQAAEWRQEIERIEAEDAPQDAGVSTEGDGRTDVGTAAQTGLTRPQP